MFTKRFTATQSSSIPKKKKTVNHPMQAYGESCPSSVPVISRLVSLGTRSFRCLRKSQSSAVPFRAGRDVACYSPCSPGSPWLCPPVSPLSVFAKSLSNVPRDLSFTLKCLSLFNNTLFVDQWPFSVALLQFGVYLSLILAIKSFAFETQTWFLLASSISSVALEICVMVWM